MTWHDLKKTWDELTLVWRHRFAAFTSGSRGNQEAEALGYGSLWLAEAVGRDPFAHAGILLSATERIVVATGIANVYARDPMTMVAGQRTLAEAFPGRFLLGLGVSHAHLVAGVRKHDYYKPYS